MARSVVRECSHCRHIQIVGEEVYDRCRQCGRRCWGDAPEGDSMVEVLRDCVALLEEMSS